MPVMPPEDPRDVLLKKVLRKYSGVLEAGEFESFKQWSATFNEAQLQYLLKTTSQRSLQLVLMDLAAQRLPSDTSSTTKSGTPSSVSSSPISSGSPSGSAASPIGSGSGSSGGPCFIATAAFGSNLQDDVVALTRFRDQYLLKYRAGMAFVSLYYRFSPALASYIGKHDSLRAVARVVLYPMVRWSKRLMDRNTPAGR